MTESRRLDLPPNSPLRTRLWWKSWGGWRKAMLALAALVVVAWWTNPSLDDHADASEQPASEWQQFQGRFGKHTPDTPQAWMSPDGQITDPAPSGFRRSILSATMHGFFLFILNFAAAKSGGGGLDGGSFQHRDWLVMSFVDARLAGTKKFQTLSIGAFGHVWVLD